jgi:exosortase
MNNKPTVAPSRGGMAAASHSLPAGQSDAWPEKRILLLFLLAIAAIWLPALLRCSVEWSVNVQYYYGWAVPLLAAYLVFERLEKLPPLSRPAHPILAGILILLLALPEPLVRLASEANSDWRLMLWGLALPAAGISVVLLYLVGGWPCVGRFTFPILFLLTAVPWPSNIENGLVQGMMHLNASISAHFVMWCGIPATAHGNVIQLPTGTLGVSEACSGIRSLQSTLMASLFLGGLYRLRFVGRVVLVVVGVGIAFTMNVVRTIFLSWQGAFHGIQATEKWHDTAGFAILGIVLVCLWFISRFLDRKTGSSASAAAASQKQ